MKKSIKEIASKIGYVLILPIGIVAYGFLRITKGKQMSNKSIALFSKKFIEEFKDDIFSYLDIQSLPMIESLAKEMTFDGNHKTIGDFYTEEHNVIDFHFLKNMFVSSLITERTDDTNAYISIYGVNIINEMVGNSVLIKLCTIKTIIHELTHYKQFLKGEEVINYSSTFDEYSKEKCEVEARKVSRKFTIKNIFKIIKFIFHN